MKRGLSFFALVAMVFSSALAGPAAARAGDVASALHALSLAPPEARTGWRWTLARLYAADSRFEEASGVLTVLAAEDPERGAAHDVRLAFATALLETGRPKAALATIDGPAFDGLNTACIVRTRALSALGNHEAALAQPSCPDLKASLARLRAAMLSQDAPQARATLAALPLALPPRAKGETSYWRGRLAQLAKDHDLARRHFRAAKRGAHSGAALRAHVRLVELDHGDRLIDSGEALARLENVRHEWRGGAAEDLLLSHMARLSLENADPASAIALLSELSAHGGDSIRKRANAKASMLYRKMLGEPAGMSVSVRFAAFWAGRDHLPAGPQGDRMVSALLDDLESAGRMDQAANLLAHQAERRLTGAARDMALERLARIYLRQGKAKRAAMLLRSLSARSADLLRLEAEVLIALGRLDEAEAKLADDDGEA
ncbi:MAG: hypothetical protein WA979_07460, partial [Pacificimonas sp.]